VVLADDKGGKIHPSVVSFHPNGSVVVGAEAKQRRIIDPRNTVYSAKRLIGRSFRSREIHAAMQRMPYLIKEGANQQPVIVTRGGEFAVPEISAIVLDHVRNVAAKALGRDVNRAVVTVPASFNDAQRSATATAGAIAGITVVRVLNEPTAAALAYGHTRQLSKVIAVYDFGGGTFDVTLLRLQDQVYEVLATAGDSFLGGDDIDELLMEHMADVCVSKLRTDVRGDELALMRLRAVAEQAKIELSRRQRALVKIDEIAYGAGGAPLNLETEITRDQLISKAAPLIERTFKVCAEALTLAGLSASVGRGRGAGRRHDEDPPRPRARHAVLPARAAHRDQSRGGGGSGRGLQALSLERILSKRSTGRGLTPMSGVPAIPARAPEPRAGEPSRTTAPMAPPPVPTRGEVGDRPASRGAQVDRFEDGGTGTHRLARITSRGTAAVPPPTPPTPPRPTGPRSKTMIGLAPEPVDEDTATFDAPTAQGPGWPTEVPREPEPAPPPRAATADARTLIAEAPTRTTDRGLGAPAPEPSPASTLPMPAGAPLTPSGPGPAPHQAATLFGVPAAAMGPAASGPAPHQAATMFGAPAGAAPAPMAMPPMPPMPPMPIDGGRGRAARARHRHRGRVLRGADPAQRTGAGGDQADVLDVARSAADGAHPCGPG
jgi:molecular chaperone DnaK